MHDESLLESFALYDAAKGSMILRGGDGGSDDSDRLRSTRDGEGGDESQSQVAAGEDGGEEGGE